MRLNIRALCDGGTDIPVNYQYQLQSAIYDLIRKSSTAHAEFLHEEGYASLESSLRRFKLFCFSRLQFSPYRFSKATFYGVRELAVVFSTAVAQNFEHLVYGIFSDMHFRLRFPAGESSWTITRVESLEEPEFRETMSFSCLSPITVSTRRDKPVGGSEIHYLDYLNGDEKEKFISNLRQNLVRKYEALYQQPYRGDHGFDLRVDPEYLIRRAGRISKLIRFKDGVVVKAMEVPFEVTADPELLKIAYRCGFGEKNSAGFGCVEVRNG